MNDDELKVIKKVFKGQIPIPGSGQGNDPFKINYTPNEAKKSSKTCQTRLSYWKEPFSQFNEQNPKGICHLPHKTAEDYLPK